jgi:hypothetical protein
MACMIPYEEIKDIDDIGVDGLDSRRREELVAALYSLDRL